MRNIAEMNDNPPEIVKRMHDMKRRKVLIRLAASVAVAGCVGMHGLPSAEPGSRVAAPHFNAGGCSPDSGELSRSYVGFYRLAAISVDDPVWTEDRAHLRLTTALDSALVVAETEDAACSTALALYATQFRTSPSDRAVVVKIDTLRAVIRDFRRDVSDSGVTMGVRPHLIANATFTAVVDTIWY